MVHAFIMPKHLLESLKRNLCVGVGGNAGESFFIHLSILFCYIPVND